MAPRAEILIAEDEPSARRGFRALFEGEGYAVRTARDGEEAVAKFIERRPDAVLLDVMMPKMNGIAACEAIRMWDALVPVLFFTAMPSDVGAVRALGLGAVDYIDKAKSPEELLARVAAVLRRVAAAAKPRADALGLGGVTVDFATMTASGDGVSADRQVHREAAQGEARPCWRAHLQHPRHRLQARQIAPAGNLVRPRHLRRGGRL